jgi:hypothetical protein
MMVQGHHFEPRCQRPCQVSNRRLDGPQSRLGRYKEQTNFLTFPEQNQ